MNDNEVSKSDITDRVLNIIGLCMDINNLEKRSIDVSGNKPAVFFSYSPHVNTIDVDFYSKGWHSRADHEQLANMLYLRKNQETIDTLDDIIYRLSQVLKECL